MHAHGPFEVKVIPQPSDAGSAAAIGRMLLDKQFHGGLEARSTGQMLAMRTAVEGSAGYVALELVDGTLDGRPGTFALQHTGVMDRGAQSLSIKVVPDSATGELVGLRGTMEIIVEAGKHSYDLDYVLPAAS